MKKLRVIFVCLLAIMGCSRQDNLVDSFQINKANSSSVIIDSVDSEIYFVDDIIKIYGNFPDSYISGGMKVNISGIDCKIINAQKFNITAKVPKMNSGNYNLILNSNSGETLLNNPIYVFGYTLNEAKIEISINGIDFERNLKTISFPRGSFNNYSTEDVDTLKNTGIKTFAGSENNEKSAFITKSLKLEKGKIVVQNLNFTDTYLSGNMKIQNSLKLSLKRKIFLNSTDKDKAEANEDLSQNLIAKDIKWSRVELQSDNLGTQLNSKEIKKLIDIRSNAKLSISISK